MACALPQQQAQQKIEYQCRANEQQPAYFTPVEPVQQPGGRAGPQSQCQHKPRQASGQQQEKQRRTPPSAIGAQRHDASGCELAYRTAQKSAARQERHRRIDAASRGTQQQPQTVKRPARQLCRCQQKQVVQQQVQQEYPIQIYHHCSHLARPL